MNSGRLVATQAAADQKAADENLHRLRAEAIEEHRLREAAAANKAAGPKAVRAMRSADRPRVIQVFQHWNFTICMEN